MTRPVVVRSKAPAYTLRGVSVQPSAADVDEATPAKAPLPSGRLLLRMPPDLHAQLAQAAEREGSSLNGYITARLRESVDGTPADADPSVRDGSSNATLTRLLVVNSVAVAFAAAVALVILLVAWLG
jgi:hypothetical protein